MDIKGNNISIKRIAYCAGMDPEDYKAASSVADGASLIDFSNYVKNYRISKAKELLVGTNLKLYEVAEKVGYSDPKYFSRIFKEITGQLPTEYRRSVK